MTSKARTLAGLAGKLKNAQVLPSFFFLARDWSDNPDRIFANIRARDDLTGDILVRSSAANEDSQDASFAGRYLSKRCRREDAHVASSIAEVVASYGDVAPDDEVLVQPYLAKTLASGVAFNVDPRSGARRDIINYTLNSDTSLVTSGGAGRVEVYIASRHPGTNHPKPLGDVIRLMRELEELTGDIPLDIEFAVTCDGQLVLLQVRHLVVTARSPLTAQEQLQALNQIHQSLVSILGDRKGMLGKRSLLGVMPDWNPAEMIGLRPRPLALSLYRFLITDGVWARQRYKYGYRDTRDVPLIIALHGLPYVDVRASFNSLLPSSLDEATAERFVDACLDRLAANPHLHDKVEFEIIPSCYSFDVRDKLSHLAGLSDRDRKIITRELRGLTRSFLCGAAGRRVCRDEEAIWRLEERQAGLHRHDESLIYCLYQVLSDCRRYGTGPFAGLARAAFVATDLLRSAVNVGLLRQEDSERFLRSLNTPASRLLAHLPLLDRQQFLQRYGHLRPGTYDIRIASYRESPDRYLPAVADGPPEPAKTAFTLSPATIMKLEDGLVHHGLPGTADGFMSFLARSIIGRETAKFTFSRSVSQALDLVHAIGADYGFTRDELSFADVRDVLELRLSTWGARDVLRRSIDLGMSRYEKTSVVALPPLISSPEDVWAFHVPSVKPNFVTQLIVEGPVRTAQAEDLSGAIVLVANADPGFDWLFGKRIGGLITAYGGSNSHMAIRAAELGLPAVIGAGEKLFEIWLRAKHLRIDCGVESVEVLA
ncbi:PEP-utilizing enzyme [Bradyrhizobium sp. SZCCHNRI20481]|uniref:PEP-utilizing enzyme n=1 Tax=Bradyrhizobium sp. SZCCHNRI20481 TaxID=3057286 RepID=UPI002915CBE2|nr:PEP-utilizing enzyme [Bradyrhizobium sp. SZCCHNRI20481]